MTCPKNHGIAEPQLHLPATHCGFAAYKLWRFYNCVAGTVKLEIIFYLK